MSSQTSGNRVLWTIFIANFLDMLGFGLILPVFGFLFENEGSVFSAIFSAADLKFYYVFFVGSFSVGTLIGAPVIGTLSDKFGRKKMLFFTYTCNIVFYLLFALGVHLVSYWLAYSARLLAGLTGGSLLIINSAIADVSKAENKAKNFGITGIAFGLGFVIGALLGSILTDERIHPLFSVKIPIIVSCVVTFCNIVFIYYMLPETFHGNRALKISLFTGLNNLVKAFTRPMFRLIFTVVYLVTLSFNFFIQFYQFYVREVLHYSKSEVGILFMYIGLSVAFTQGVILRPIADHWRPRYVLTGILPLFALSYLLILTAETRWAFYLCTFLIILCQGITFPTTLAFISNRVSREVQGETIGINQAVLSAAAASTIILGSVFVLSHSLPMWFGAITTFVAWLYFILNIYVIRKDII